MQSLRADERPISHYRAAKLREEQAKASFSLRLPRLTWRRIEVEEETARSTSEVRAEPLLLGSRRSEPPVVAKAPKAQPGFLARVTAAALAKDPSDPSPTRLEYRIERLWLTPFFRLFMRIGLPVVLIGGMTTIYFANPDHRAAIAAKVDELRTQIENRPEFMVSLMSIDGASGPVADAIRKMLPVKLPASSFAIDLEAMRASIEQIDAVESARLKVKAGGVLAVDVVERKPAILWRTATSLEMLDATGHRVATLLDRSARPDLPVVAGEGAEAAIPEALAILKAAGPILPRVRGLVRVSDRRWDMVLDREQRIMLPAKDAIQAVEQAMALDGAEELLARDISAVDLRNSERPTVRLTAAGLEEMRKLTDSVTKVAGQ